MIIHGHYLCNELLAALVAKKALAMRCFCRDCNPQAPDVTDLEVFIINSNYSVETIARMVEVADHVTLFDSDPMIYSKLKGIIGNSRLSLIVDTAPIHKVVHNYFFPGTEYPKESTLCMLTSL